MLKSQPNQTVEQFIAFKKEIESLKYWKNLYKHNAVYYWLMATDGVIKKTQPFNWIMAHDGLIKKTQRFTLDELSQIVISAGYTRQYAHKIKLYLERCINLYNELNKYANT